MDAYNTINDILVHLFNEIWELEKKAIITGTIKRFRNTISRILLMHSPPSCNNP